MVVTIPYEIEEPGDFTDRKADLRYDWIMQGMVATIPDTRIF